MVPAIVAMGYLIALGLRYVLGLAMLQSEAIEGLLLAGMVCAPDRMAT